jgi:hypothetical protein
MDALSEVLSHVRLKDTSWAWSIATAPWGFSLPESKRGVRFHYVAQGSCWLSTGESTQPRIALSGGDLAVITQGQTHTVRDQPRTPAIRWGELAVQSTTVAPGVNHLKFGGGGAESTMVCGMFVLDSPLEAIRTSQPSADSSSRCARLVKVGCSRDETCVPRVDGSLCRAPLEDWLEKARSRRG